MPYAINPKDGVRLYYEVEGSGPPLVLHHGGGRTLQRWRDLGYDDALRDDFQLILFDARAHGKSDKPVTPEAYRYERWVQDIVAILDELAIDRAHFFGYSLGGLVGFRIPVYVGERFTALVLGGCHPFEAYDFWQSEYELFRDGGQRYVELREQAGNPVTVDELEELRAGVWEAAMLGLRDEPGVEEMLPGNAIPTMLFVGSADQRADVGRRALEAGPAIGNGLFLVLNGLDHGSAFAQTDLVVPHVRAFLGRREEERPI